MTARRGIHWRPSQRAGEFTLPSTLSVGSPSSESENQTLSSRQNFKGNLEKEGVTNLIVAGGMTEYCVDTTCRRATSLGYDVTLAGDAHLTRDNGVLTAANIIAHHNFVLDDFGAGDYVITVKPADQIIF